MPYVAIFDFSVGKVYIHKYEGHEDKSGDELVNHFGHNDSDCQHMCMDELKLVINEPS